MPVSISHCFPLGIHYIVSTASLIGGATGHFMIFSLSLSLSVHSSRSGHAGYRSPCNAEGRAAMAVDRLPSLLSLSSLADPPRWAPATHTLSLHLLQHQNQETGIRYTSHHFNISLLTPLNISLLTPLSLPALSPLRSRPGFAVAGYVPLLCIKDDYGFC